MKLNTQAQAQLWVGSHESMIDQLHVYLQKHLCEHGACGVCGVCMQIRTQQHHAVTWIAPEKQYTLDMLKQMHEQLAFKLDQQKKHFFILQHVEHLSLQCANNLLKPIEEPPEGYYFILCTTNSDVVVPTIVSRCIIRSFEQTSHTTKHQELINFFTTAQTSPNELLSYLQKNTISEAETERLLEHIFSYWMQQHARTTSKDTTSCEPKIETIKKMLSQPIMPGSSKLVWKNLFIQFFAHTHNR